MTTSFLSTYPVRGTTFQTKGGGGAAEISIHVPRAGYDNILRHGLNAGDISIHVPRAGYDQSAAPLSRAFFSISIHVPRAGYDVESLYTSGATIIFLSTYPVRGTTRWRGRRCPPVVHFYPRTPCGVRPGEGQARRARAGISIHVPRAGYDAAFVCVAGLSSPFLSTYPVRGTTLPSRVNVFAWEHFYPRTPCGVRRNAQADGGQAAKISIRVPRAGYDGQPARRVCDSLPFLSTYPVRGTTPPTCRRTGSLTISIHVPRAGYDSST